jgi:hypothetical protein
VYVGGRKSPDLDHRAWRDADSSGAENGRTREGDSCATEQHPDARED